MGLAVSEVRGIVKRVFAREDVLEACARRDLGVIVPDGVAGLGIGDIDWAGDSSVLLSYVKGRTAAESRTLPLRAVRLLEQWLEHSAQARGHAPAELRDRLWLYYSHVGRSRWQTTPDASTQQAWARQRWQQPSTQPPPSPRTW